MKCICSAKRFYIFSIIFVLLNLMFASAMADEKRLKPFIMANGHASGDIATLVKATAGQLKQSGFEIVGDYSPYPNTNILVITSPGLRQQAAQSPFGAYGAVQRVSITKTESGTQIAYTNPEYMAHAYRMKSDLADVQKQLAGVLGNEGQYGSEKGLTAEELRDYQYKWLMPYFTDRHELAYYRNQQAALEKVEKVLATKVGGAAKVYRVDLPGRQESVFGISLPGPKENDCSGDQYIMSRIDFKKLKSSGHLPYEVVVSEGKVYALFAEFRIAINFPDLSMMGSNSFASIMCAPESIKKALTKAVGGSGEGDF